MGLKVGSNCYLYLNSKDLSTYITGCTIDLKGKTLVDVTAMGASHKAWASDEMGDLTFTIDFLFDDTTTSGPWIVLDTMWDKHTTTTYDLRPNGAGTYPLFSGGCYIENVPIAVTIGDMIRMSGVVFKNTGTPTVTPEA